jgi:hypothetical protein
VKGAAAAAAAAVEEECNISGVVVGQEAQHAVVCIVA